MPSISQENLEIVMIFAALRRGDFDAASALLDRDVTWQGLHEERICHGREEVIATFRWGRDERRDADALEFIGGGDRVVMGVRGPGATGVEGVTAGWQIFNVFTLRDGRIVRIDDYRQRGEALSAAGIAADPGWR